MTFEELVQLEFTQHKHFLKPKELNQELAFVILKNSKMHKLAAVI